MRYVAAYLLAVLGGKAAPVASDVEKILSSVGIEADSEKLKKVIAELNGKSVEELIAQGMLNVFLFLLLLFKVTLLVNFFVSD